LLAEAELIAHRHGDGGKGRLAAQREEVATTSALKESRVYFTGTNQRRQSIRWREAVELLEVSVNLSYEPTKFPYWKALGGKDESMPAREGSQKRSAQIGIQGLDSAATPRWRKAKDWVSSFAYLGALAAIESPFGIVRFSLARTGGG